MARAYWITFYRAVGDPAALSAYARLAGPAIVAAGGHFLARGPAAAAYKQGVLQRVTMAEFDGVERAVAARGSGAATPAFDSE